MNRQSSSGVQLPSRLEAGSISRKVPMRITIAKLTAMIRAGNRKRNRNRASFRPRPNGSGREMRTGNDPVTAPF